MIAHQVCQVEVGWRIVKRQKNRGNDGTMGKRNSSNRRVRNSDFVLLCDVAGNVNAKC